MKDKPQRPSRKPIGAYLVEAGLLTEAQVGVVLADQASTAMTFGDIVVTRGWVKSKTVEYLMRKVIIPERSGMIQDPDLKASLSRQPPRGRAKRPASPRKPPIAETDGGVNWIG
ncbi:hypothetical protein [Lyngbya confervoides]|uniref:Uncharacterized protein n=1 Tax=Lyngbya confervoides BDU141951 TaxID=1574623 RepID=A0ABD4T3P1_9CYAN|nr:hypothetical protein [Lyngbya confervoides]MCM1983313.1 hypothetical protein [Lyngbya confervoides BDU141951]